jgi:hypothetical protein
MAAFWRVLTHYATKLALYAAEHPDQVAAVVDAAKKIKR